MSVMFHFRLFGRVAKSEAKDVIRNVRNAFKLVKGFLNAPLKLFRRRRNSIW